MTEYESVAWTRWTPAGYSGEWCRAHLISPFHRDRTLCGVPIPDPRSDPGVEVESGELGVGECKRCGKAAARAE